MANWCMRGGAVLLCLFVAEASSAEEAHGVAEPPTDESVGLLPALDLGFGIPKLSIRGFGHAQYAASFLDPDGGSSNSMNNFANGGVDVFITSQIAEDVSFLNEIVFEFGEGGENILDVERVFLKYEHEDWLHVGIGRGHTALGYWNQQFHHGTWLQTTTDRPMLFDFEDDGGILPIHFVGIEASGRIKTKPGVFSYSLGVSNGRGDIVDSVQLVEDATDSKAVALMGRFEPSPVPGFGVGFSAYIDRIPDNDTPSDGSGPRPRSTREQIYSAHMFYVRRKVEALAEFTVILHEPSGSPSRFEHYGGYVLLAYRCSTKTKPYYRFDILVIDRADPFYSGLVEDKRRHTVGVRYEFRKFVALKAEFQHVDSDSGRENTGILQASFAF